MDSTSVGSEEEISRLQRFDVSSTSFRRMESGQDERVGILQHSDVDSESVARGREAGI